MWQEETKIKVCTFLSYQNDYDSKNDNNGNHYKSSNSNNNNDENDDNLNNNSNNNVIDYNIKNWNFISTQIQQKNYNTKVTAISCITVSHLRFLFPKVNIVKKKTYPNIF